MMTERSHELQGKVQKEETIPEEAKEEGTSPRGSREGGATPREEEYGGGGLAHERDSGSHVEFCRSLGLKFWGFLRSKLAKFSSSIQLAKIAKSPNFRVRARAPRRLEEEFIRIHGYCSGS